MQPGKKPLGRALSNLVFGDSGVSAVRKDGKFVEDIPMNRLPTVSAGGDTPLYAVGGIKVVKHPPVRIGLGNGDFKGLESEPRGSEKAIKKRSNELWSETRVGLGRILERTRSTLFRMGQSSARQLPRKEDRERMWEEFKTRVLNMVPSRRKMKPAPPVDLSL